MRASWDDAPEGGVGGHVAGQGGEGHGGGLGGDGAQVDGGCVGDFALEGAEGTGDRADGLLGILLCGASDGAERDDGGECEAHGC